MTREPQRPRPAASTPGVDDVEAQAGVEAQTEVEARSEELADQVEDDRRQQELDYAELGGEG